MIKVLVAATENFTRGDGTLQMCLRPSHVGEQHLDLEDALDEVSSSARLRRLPCGPVLSRSAARRSTTARLTWKLCWFRSTAGRAGGRLLSRLFGRAGASPQHARFLR